MKDGKLGGATSKHKKEHRIWRNMRYRCNTRSCPQYKDYGGRGISVCEQWNSFTNFYNDMGDCGDGLSIDRRDNSGNYCKKNCRWATHKEQANNKRKQPTQYKSRTMIKLEEKLKSVYGKLYSEIFKSPGQFPTTNEIIKNGSSN